ncbi:MAG: CFI-box-CTERM domain-containing protein [Pseudomonadota bacterium]
MGITMGFPARSAPCTSSARFNEFEAKASGNGVWLEYTRSGPVTPKIFLWPSGTVVIWVIYIGQLDIGSPYNVRMRFSDGSKSVLPMYPNIGDLVDGQQSSILSEAVKDDRLLKKIRAASWMTIEIEGNANQPIVPNGKSARISLKGSNAAADWAIEQLPTCDGISEGAGAVSYCFLTTACVEMLGLDDDCFELRALRRYRDEVMLRTKHGRALVEVYREVAPKILAALDGLPRRRRQAILRAVYGRYVLPSAIGALLGFNGVAERIYVRMMQRLLADHAPGVFNAPGALSNRVS